VSQAPEHAFWAGFRDLDRDQAPEALITQQEALAAWPPIRDGKRRSYELLDLRPGDSVLDVGCGTGGDVAALSRIVGPAGRAAGVDKSARSISLARERGDENSDFTVADADELPFDDATFDACRTERTLQHARRPRRALMEMARVTRPGGRIAATDSRAGLVGLEQLNPEVTAPVLGHVFPDEAWIAHFLPLLFQQAGLAGLELTSQTGRASGWETIRDGLGLEAIAQRLVADGTVTPPAMADWYEACRQACDAGNVELEITVVHLLARR